MRTWLRLAPTWMLVACGAASGGGREAPGGDVDTDVVEDSRVLDTDEVPDDSPVPWPSNESDPPDDSEPSDSLGIETGEELPAETGGGETGEPPTDDTALPVPSPGNLWTGDLVITEVHIDPVGCAVGQGAYLELRNVSGTRVNLRSLRLVIATRVYIVSPYADLIVRPGAYAVAETDAAACPYSPAVASAFTFPASNVMPLDGSVVMLRTTSNVLVDMVNFTRFGGFGVGAAATLPGRALHLVGPETAVANDAQSAWCMADTPLPGSTADFGTPGARATSCHVPVDTGDTGHSDPPPETGHTWVCDGDTSDTACG